MNVHQLLEDLIYVQIGNKKYNVGKDCVITPLSNDYIGLDHIFSNSFLKTYDANFIQLHQIGSSAILHKFILTAEEVDICNTQGLEIFLTEQMYFQCGPGDTLPIADFVNLKIDDNLSAYPLYWQTCNYNIKSLELDSCKAFVSNNKLTKVTVHICNADPKKHLSHYNFTIGYKNPFLQAIFNILAQTVRTPSSAESIDYKFWCGNWRYEPHRHLIAAYLANCNAKLGWHFTGNKKSIEHFYWFDIDNWRSIYPMHYNKICKGIDLLNSNHYFIDIKPQKYNLNNNMFDVGLRPAEDGEHPSWRQQVNQNSYSNSFCSVINLGTFADCFPIYDEKPLIAIRNFKPFILVGPPGSLQMMKDDGFKTFSAFWDESYDTEQDHQKRFIKIFEVFNYIENLSIDECRTMYKAMSSILQHNYNIISNGMKF